MSPMSAAFLTEPSALGIFCTLSPERDRRDENAMARSGCARLGLLSGQNRFAPYDLLACAKIERLNGLYLPMNSIKPLGKGSGRSRGETTFLWEVEQKMT